MFFSVQGPIDIPLNWNQLIEYIGYICKFNDFTQLIDSYLRKDSLVPELENQLFFY